MKIGKIIFNFTYKKKVLNIKTIFLNSCLACHHRLIQFSSGQTRIANFLLTQNKLTSNYSIQIEAQTVARQKCSKFQKNFHLVACYLLRKVRKRTKPTQNITKYLWPRKIVWKKETKSDCLFFLIFFLFFSFA